MADKKPTQEQYAKFKARANDKSISAEARATFQKLVDKFKSEFETAEKEVEKVVEDKPKATRGRKAGTTAKKRTTKPKTEQSADDIAKAKAEIKKRTGKTEEECESIIEEYKSLRTKAQTRKKAETKAKEDNTKRVNKLKKEDNIIEGTTEKTADAVIETNTKDIAEKIEKEISKVEDKVEREETAKAKKEVEKTSPNKSATEKKKEVEKKVEAQVKKKVKAKTKVVVKKVIIDTTAMLSSIAESLGKFDKDSQKEFLMKLRSDIDKLLAKYMYGGDVSGATQQLDITQSNLSASSVNPSKFARGGEVQTGDRVIITTKTLGKQYEGMSGEVTSRKLLNDKYSIKLANGLTMAFEKGEFRHDTTYPNYAKGGGMKTRRPKYIKGGKIERLKERIPIQTKLHQKELADLKRGKRKTINQYYVQGDYGYGWEDLTSHDTRSEALLEKITYDENESYPHRVVNKRIRKADFDSGNYAEGGRMKNMMRERRGM